MEHNYRNGCRCDACRQKNTARQARRRARLRTMTPPPELHGNASTYCNWGCRCEPCVEANKVKQREYRERKEEEVLDRVARLGR